ncbi:uncharacterized protein LOC132262056 [Phlebotomus argentipes]|uniref:uncharacterized protein LOC132262056 n=1 Tax=Phlebotomus argentipes TaxID=94469 RepID=UPI0028932200|nr:uncharacterized protein LOC132262056 [Phlebotomus argentipes]
MDLAAIREARRKKILENSANRLGKITGRPPQENSPPQRAVPQVNGEIYPDPELEPTEEFMPRFFGANAQNEDILHLLNSTRPGANANPPGKRWSEPPQNFLSRILGTKVHIAFIGIFVYMLFSTGNEHIVAGNVFLPLILWELADFLVMKNYQSRSSVSSIVFIISCIPTLTSTVWIFEKVYKVLQDVSIFTSFFVMSHLFWHKFILGSDLVSLLDYPPPFERL